MTAIFHLISRDLIFADFRGSQKFAIFRGTKFSRISRIAEICNISRDLIFADFADWQNLQDFVDWLYFCYQFVSNIKFAVIMIAIISVTGERRKYNGCTYSTSGHYIKRVGMFLRCWSNLPSFLYVCSCFFILCCLLFHFR